jgi:hypothetical protein
MELTEQWVHTTEPGKYSVGGICGWRDDDSPTGYLSGVVVRVDYMHLRVLVRDVRPGVMK